MNKFAKRLKGCRNELHLKQEYLAKSFSVTAVTISRWESGSMEPSYLTLASLAKFFGVTTDYLLGLED